MSELYEYAQERIEENDFGQQLKEWNEGFYIHFPSHEAYTSEKYADTSDSWAFGESIRTRSNHHNALRSLKLPEVYVKMVKKYLLKLQNHDKVRALQQQAIQIRKTKVYEADGDELDIDRLMGANTEHWQRMRRHRLSNIVDITANVAFSAGEDERIFYKTGALTAILSDLMERAGFCTRIHYFLGVRRGSNAVDTTTGFGFTLKQASEQTDIRRIATMGLPGLLRDNGLGQMEKYTYKPSWGHGRPYSPNEDERKHLGIENYIYVGNALTDIEQDFEDFFTQSDIMKRFMQESM